MVSILRPKEYLAKKNSALKLGDAVTHDLTHNCVTCVRWSGCKDPRKAFTFRCSRFNENSIDNSTMDDPHNVANFFGLAQPESLLDKAEVSEYDAQIEHRIDEMISAALAENSPIPPDLKIQDSSIPRAPNYFTWLMDERFAGGPNSMPPFPRQIYVGSLLFGEHCVVEGTRVQTNKGLVRIEEICADLGQNDVSGWMAISRAGKQKITLAGKTSRRKLNCLHIESNGRSFTVTPNHRVLVNRSGWALEWVRADNLRIGDNLVAPYAHGMFATNWPKLPVKQEFLRLRKLNRSADLKWPRHVTKELCYVIGYLLGDGSLNDYGVCLTNADAPISAHFRKCMKTLTGMLPNATTAISKTTNGVTYYSDRYNSIELADWFKLIGLKMTTHESKEIPDFIFKCPKEGVVAFLKGILETDGCITSSSIRLAMTSEKIVSGVALLMQNLGIFGTTKVVQPKTKSHWKTQYWWSCHQKDYLVKLHTIFGKFYSNRGDGSQKDEPSFTSLRPQTAPGVLKNSKFISANSKDRVSYHEPKYPNTKFRHNSAHFYHVEEAIRNLEKYNHLEEHTEGAREVFNNQYSLCTITSITDAGSHYVYDITVPVSESFTANGFMVHNCPRCSDMQWFDNMKVDAKLSRIEERVVFLHKGVCPKCAVDRGELVDEGELLNPFELSLICGQRSTKTSSILLMEGYNHHRFLKLPSPSKVYRQLAQQMFTSTYTSSTFGQVKANVWDPFLNMINSVPWFTNYHKFLANRGRELGEELAVISEIFVRYKHRNLFISPASPSGMTMRGRTRWSAFIDEISHMPLQRASGKEAVKANAKDTYVALRNSLDTLIREYEIRFSEGYYDLPKPMMYNASSPLTRNDYGMTLLRQSKISEKMLGLLYPTWEFNPKLPRSYFDDRFRKDPVIAARDYGCQPPIGTSNWISDTQSIEKAFGAKRNMFTIKPYTFRSKSQKKMTSAFLAKKFSPQLNWGCILALDIGAVNNSFAFSVGTVDNDFDLPTYVRSRKQDEIGEDDSDQDVETGLVPLRVIFAGEIIPRRDAEISQHRVYKDVLSLLINELPIELVISDRWQNKKLVQDMEAEFGIEYVDYQLNWEDFENFKSSMYERKVVLPKLSTSLGELAETVLDNYPYMFENKPIDHLAYQFLTVQEARGNTVVKGDATDDMFRTIALLHAAVQDTEMLESLLNVEDESMQKPALGVVLSNNSVSSSGQTMTLKPRGHTSPIAYISRSRR